MNYSALWIQVFWVLIQHHQVIKNNLWWNIEFSYLKFGLMVNITCWFLPIADPIPDRQQTLFIVMFKFLIFISWLCTISNGIYFNSSTGMYEIFFQNFKGIQISECCSDFATPHNIFNIYSYRRSDVSSIK